MLKRVFVLFILGLAAAPAALAGENRWNQLPSGSVACSEGYRVVKKEQPAARSGENHEAAASGKQTAGAAR